MLNVARVPETFIRRQKIKKQFLAELYIVIYEPFSMLKSFFY